MPTSRSPASRSAIRQVIEAQPASATARRTRSKEIPPMVRSMVRSIFALAALLSVASATLAADLVTPMVLVGGSTRVNCRLINLSAAPVETHVQLIAYGGSVPADGG